MRYEKWIKDWKTALAENFFLRTLSLLMAIALIINVVVLRGEDRIVIVPSEMKEQHWIKKETASKEYLEQMANFFALLGGNLSPLNAEYNVQTLISYVPPSVQPSVRSELGAQSAYIKKNNITQAFFPNSIDADEESGDVTVTGKVIRNIGTTKISEEEMVVKMRLVVNNYKLFLDEFYMDYPQRKKDELIRKGEIIETEEEKKANREETRRR